MQTEAKTPAGTFVGYLLYCLVLFIPLAHVPFGYHTLFAIEFRRSMIAMLLLLIGGGYLALQRRYWRRKMSVHRPMLVLFGALILASGFSQNRPLAFEASLHLLLGGLIFYLAAFHVDPQRDLARLRAAICLATALVSCYSLAQHLGANPLGLIAEGERQRSATFVTRNLLAAYLLFGLIFQLDGLLRETRRPLLACHGLAAAASLAALVLSLTVSAWLALVAGLAGYLWFARRLEGFETGRLKLLLAALLAAALFAGLIEQHKPEAQRHDFRDKIASLARGESQSVRERIVMWRIAGRIFLDNMVLGCGPGNYAIVRDRYAGDYLGQTRYRDLHGLSVWAHNDLLQLAAETGAAGLIPLLLLLCAAGMLPFALLRKSDATRSHLAQTLPFWAGWLGLSCHALFHYTLYAPASAFYWWLSLGLVAGVDLRVVRKPAFERGISRYALKALLVCVTLAAPIGLASQSLARYAQARGFRARLAGERLTEQGKPRQAEQQFQSARGDYALAARLRPWAGTLWAQLGTLERSRNRLGAARVAYHRALYWRPYDAQVHHKIGLLYLQLGLLDPADQYAAQAIRLRPNLAPAHCLRGLVARRQGRKVEALDFFKQAREADPGDSGGYHWGALTLFELDRHAQMHTLLELGTRKIRNVKGGGLLVAHLFAIRALSRGLPQEALRIWQASSRAYGGMPLIDNFMALAKERGARRIEYMQTETVHELLSLTGALLRRLRHMPRPRLERLRPLYRELADTLLASLQARLAERPADALSVQAIRTLAQIDQQLQLGLRQVGRSTDMYATRYARELIRGILPALERGPIFPQQTIDRPKLMRLLHRLRSLGRPARVRRKLHTPLLLAELRLYRKLLLPGTDRIAPGERLIDDLLLLEAEGLQQAGLPAQAEKLLLRLTTGFDEDRATLLPPWAARIENPQPAALAYFERHRPRSADQARLKLAGLALQRKQPRQAARMALALFERMGRAGRLSHDDLPSALRSSALARATLDNQVDRRALDLATLAWLTAGDVRAAAENERAIGGHFPDQEPRMARNLERLATEAGRQAVARELRTAFDEY